MRGRSRISTGRSLMALSTAMCIAVAALSGCGGATSGGTSIPQSSAYPPGTKPAIALNTAVRAARSLDSEYPHAHDTQETVGMESPRVSYDASSISDGWTFRVAVSDACPPGTGVGFTCGSQDDYYIVVRRGRGTIIAHTAGHGTGGYTLQGAAVADCRFYACTAQGDFPGCGTCATITGAPVEVSGNGLRFLVRTHAGLGFTLQLPPGAYLVTPEPFDGMTADKQRVVVPQALGEQRPWPLVVRYR